jgi:hypothetical protein
MQSVRGSTALDLMIPVTQEHRMYLAGIEEDEEDCEESRKF